MRKCVAVNGGAPRPAPFTSGARLPLLLCACLAFLTAAGGRASAGPQRGSGGVSGTVYDENGDVVAGASVTAFNVESGVERQTATDGEGSFSIRFLPPGTYSVVIRRGGFKTVDVRDVTLGPAGHVRLRVRLSVGVIEEYVTVSSGAGGELAEGGAGAGGAPPTSFDRNFIERHPPAGGNLQALAALAPGAVVTRTDFNEQGQFSVNGQRANANYFMVDGVSANFGVSAGPAPGQAPGGSLPALTSFGGMSNLVSAEAVREFTLRTVTYDAESGRTPGAQVSVTTSSGTDEWRGSAFYSFGRGALNANDWFVNARALPRPPAGQDDFGGVAGGPVFRKRTYAFLSYEGLRATQPRVAVTAVPSATTRLLASPSVRPFLDAFPRPNGRELRTGSGAAEFAASYGEPSSLDAWSVRLDHAAAAGLSLFGRYAQAPSRTALRGGLNPPTTTARLTFGFGRPLAQSLSTVTESSFETRTLTLGADYARGAAVTLTTRLNWSYARGATRHRLDDFGGATPPPEGYLFPRFASQADGLVQIVVLRPVDMAANLRVGRESDNFNRQLNLVGALGVSRGDHDLKFGGDYRRLSPVFAPPAYTQTATFRGFGLDPLDPDGAISGTAAGAQIYSDDLPRRPVFHNLSLFARDVWRVAGSLTVSYGLRWELNPPPREANGNHPAVLSRAVLERISGLVTYLLSGKELEFAPRGTPLWATDFGNFAPRVGVAYHVSRSETTLRAGFGIYYDLGNGQAAQAFGSVMPYTRGRRVGRVPFPLAGVNALPPPPEFSPGAGTLFAYDPRLRAPYTMQWSGTVEQRVGPAHLLSVAYVGARGRRLTRGEVFLQPFPSTGFFGDSTIVLTRNAARSDYHAMQAQFTRRLSSGLDAYASYTWSHSIDNASDDSSIRLHPVAAFPVSDRGPSDFDVRHSLSAAVGYDIPAPLRGRVGGALARGWFVGAVARWRTATPVNITTQANIFGGGLVQYLRPNLLPGAPLYVNDPGAPGGRYINAAAFAPNGGREGSLGRNALRGFAASQVDFTLGRKFKLAGRLLLQLRADAYNVFNHPNFANPSAGFVATRTLGDSLGTGGATGGLIPMYQLGGPRTVRLTMRLGF